MLADKSADRRLWPNQNMRQLVNTLTERLDELQQTAAVQVSDWNPVETAAECGVRRRRSAGRRLGSTSGWGSPDVRHRHPANDIGRVR